MIEVISITELQNHRTSIELICPKCGNPGRLRIISPKSEVGLVRFKIVHGADYRQRTCTFGYSSEEYEELREIYFGNREVIF